MQEFLARVNPKQKKIFTSLRSAIKALPEVEESIEIDEVSGEWCPAYRVRGTDLAWVRFEDRLAVTFPVEPNFEKKVYQDENLDSSVVAQVKDAEESGESKWASVDIKSTDDVDSVFPVLKLRHSILMA
jgi:hypothetical protein